MDKNKTILDVINSIPDLIEKHEKYSCIKEKLHSIPSYERMAVIGSGSSYNAAFATQLFAKNELHLTLELYYPDYFYNHILNENMDKETLYVFISQGGKTKTVLDCIDKMNKNGYFTISLTEDLSAPIAQEAKIAFEIGSNAEPFMFRTSGYSLTVFSLLNVLVAISSNSELIDVTEEEKFTDDFKSIPKDIEKVTKLASNWYVNHKSDLSNIQSFYFAGGGDLWPVAQEASIKFMETVPCLTTSYEIEEIIHGPQNSFTSDSGYFLIANNNEEMKKAKKINEFIHAEITKNSFIVGTKKDAADFIINPESDNFKNLTYVAFFQVLSYLIATDRGRDLHYPVYPQITKYIHKTI